MRPRLHEPLLIFVPCALLFVLTRLNYWVWPPVWPDEALFSSPAITLVEQGIFATPVLQGLIPGMETATLWNSPLYMVLVAGLYAFTGESLLVARGLSFLLGCGALLAFFRLARMFLAHRFLALFLTVLLALDPTFQRAANTARMDMLTLLFFLLAFFLLARARLLSAQRGGTADLARRARQRFVWAGVCIGGAAISHPAAILLVPVTLLFALPGKRNLLWIGAGMVAPLLAWAVYIIPHFDIFQIQFLSQLVRKGDMVRLWGGDTGGVLVVYAAQFGGTRLLMIFSLLLVGIVGLFGLPKLMHPPAGTQGPLFVRLFLSFAIVFLLVLFASEAWYPVYVTPLLLLVAGVVAAEPGSSNLRRLPLALAGLFFFAATFTLVARQHFVLRAPVAARLQLEESVRVARGCRSIYLRVRPDPYFDLRRAYPAMEVLEFIPGKLRFEAEGGRRTFLERRYAEIHCFLLDGNDSWEPVLSAYLNRKFRAFRRTTIVRRGPYPEATLWRRR